MKTLFPALFLSLFTVISNTAQVLLKISNDSIIGYSYDGGEEFNSPVLDEKVWFNGLPWARVLMTQDVAFSKKNVLLKDGLINFVTLKEDSNYVLAPTEIDSAYLKKTKTKLVDNKFLAKYSVGCIMSRQKYHYGIYELRFQVDKGKGVWPAFWFYGGNKNEEIDCFELKNERNNEIHVDTHCPTGCDKGYKNKLGLNTNWGGWMPVTNFLQDGFNIMYLEWKKEEVVWYINGYPLAYFKGRFPNPMNLYLNNSVAKDGGAFKPGPDETTKWPNNYFVDYFRSWKEIEKGKEIKLIANNNLIVSDKFKSDYSNKPSKKRGLMYKKKKLETLDGMISLSLNSDFILNINILGNINDVNSTVKIKGATSGQILEVPKILKDQEVKLNPIDKEIEITIVTKEKSYTQKIVLSL